MPKMSGSRLTVPLEEPSEPKRGALISATSLHRLSNDHIRALRARYGATEQQEAALSVDPDHLEVESGHLVVAHAARHPHPLEDAGGSGAGPDRTRRPVLLVISVRCALTGEVVTLHHAGEPLALGGAGDVGFLARFEVFSHGALLSGLESGDVRHTHLHHGLRRRNTGLGVVALDGLVDPVRLGLAEGDLEGGVAVGLGRL